MTELLLAVGALVALEPPAWGNDDPGCVVRVGLDEQRIATLNELAVWQSLTRVPQGLGDLAATFFVPDGEGETAAAPADEVAATVQRLRDRGLVVGLNLDGPELMELGMRLRPVPLYQAVPSGRSGPGRVAIGYAQQAVVYLDAEQHALWAQLDDCRSVTHLAVARAVRDGTDPADPDLRAAWRTVVDLVVAGAVSLDLAIG